MERLYSLDRHFTPVGDKDCPCSSNQDSFCNDFPECSYGMTVNDLCEADRALPDGNTNYNIDNCPGGHDIFRYVGGKLSS